MNPAFTARIHIKTLTIPGHSQARGLQAICSSDPPSSIFEKAALRLSQSEAREDYPQSRVIHVGFCDAEGGSACVG
jgi:hypothetical protein